MKNVFNNIKRMANAVVANINDDQLSANDLAYIDALMHNNGIIY